MSSQIINCMNILRVEDELFQANRQTEKQEDARTDGWSNRHKVANNRVSKLSNTPKEAGTLAQALCSTRPRAGRLRDHSRIPRIAKLFLSSGVSPA